MKFLLDTDVLIGIGRRNHQIGEKIRALPKADVCTSSIVLHKLYFGAFKSGRVSQNLATLMDIGLETIVFDDQDAVVAGELRAKLVGAGRPIGPYDIMIAGQALARDLTLVTHNQREFLRVPGLRLEDWEA